MADIVPLTDLLEKSLMKLPVSEVLLTAANKDRILNVFRKRRDGPIAGRGIQVRLVEDIHVAAWLLHPTKCPADYDEYYQRFYTFVQGYVASIVLPDSETDSSSEESDSALEAEKERDDMVGKITKHYDEVHGRWMLNLPKASNRSGRETTSRDGQETFPHDNYGYRSSPLRFWSDEMRLGNCKELCELAIRTLSISPSSCAAERSFSTQGRIRTNARNRLRPDVVRKLMFVKWNISHLDESQMGVPGHSCPKGSSQQVSQQNDECSEDDDGETTDGSDSEAEDEVVVGDINSVDVNPQDIA